MGKNIERKIIVISAINFFEGGPLAVLYDSIDELVTAPYQEYNFKILVHDRGLFKKYLGFKHVCFIEFPKSRKSYIFRVYYEYIYFFFLSRKWDVFLWFSLHDISPFVRAHQQVVYCHNPSVFRNIHINDIFLQPKLFFFTLFYKYLYRINIHANTYVVVQSVWMKEAFQQLYSIPESKLIVARPNIRLNLGQTTNGNTLLKNDTFTFVYPAFPRTFKNFEIIGKACEILTTQGVKNFKVYLTIDGSENPYSKKVYNKYKHLNCINFIGLISREEVFVLYQKSDVLIFPSTLETWGLPITEFKALNKPILLVDLPYAYETLGKYEKVAFFSDTDALQLAALMKNQIDGNQIYEGNEDIVPLQPCANNWTQLFEILLN